MVVSKLLTLLVGLPAADVVSAVKKLVLANLSPQTCPRESGERGSDSPHGG